MTNAEYIEAIGARCSRRTYSHTPPDPRVLEILQEMVDAVNRQSGLSFRLLADGTAPFTLFTGKFALVAVCGPDTEWARIQSGYFGESIVLQCVYHGLGTCWVTGTYNENKLYQMLDLPRDLRLYGVITIGNVKPGKSMKEKMMYNATHKTNKPYQKMMEACDRALPEPYVFAMQWWKRRRLPPTGGACAFATRKARSLPRWTRRTRTRAWTLVLPSCIFSWAPPTRVCRASGTKKGSSSPTIR